MTTRANYEAKIQDRDLQLFRDLVESRVMRTPHVAKLYFDGSEAAASKRIGKLKNSGFLHGSSTKPSDYANLSLTKKAFDELVKNDRLAGCPPMQWKSLERRLEVSDRTIQHELNVMDVKAALRPAVERYEGLSLIEFTVWPRLCAFTIDKNYQMKPVEPDGFFRIHRVIDEAQYLFYLEVDRGSESLNLLVDKASDYKAYLQSGHLAERLRVDKAPFRVLMIFRTPSRRRIPELSIERRNNAAERLTLAGHKSFVWLTTLEEIVENPLGPIWVTPEDYRTITEHTSYEPRPRNPKAPYLRRPDRERFVEEALQGRKRSLFLE